MKNIFVTGGAGFIGFNVCKFYLDKGYSVCAYDNLSRKGTEINIRALKKYPKFKFVKGDINNFELLAKNIKDSDLVFHLAAQVAVTTSVGNPRHDFLTNAQGTLNVLEAVRLVCPKAILLYSSTNKVYGGMENEKLQKTNKRYAYKKHKNGISETYPLDFHSPYGCSKGSADQYVRDYARIFNLNTIVFRQSCIYGPPQIGVEDQGWIAWFIIAILLGRKITIYGDGKQVRDVLYIDDLVNAYDLATKKIKTTKGQIYNIGGGNKFSISIWAEFKPILEKLLARKIDIKYDKERPGDQKIYISDISKAKKDFSWEPKVSPEEGISRMVNWVGENLPTIKKVFQK